MPIPTARTPASLFHCQHRSDKLSAPYVRTNHNASQLLLTVNTGATSLVHPASEQTLTHHLLLGRPPAPVMHVQHQKRLGGNHPAPALCPCCVYWNCSSPGGGAAGAAPFLSSKPASSASTITVSSSTNSPRSRALAIVVSSSRCTARLTGLAPYTGS